MCKDGIRIESDVSIEWKIHLKVISHEIQAVPTQLSLIFDLYFYSIWAVVDLV